ncbi:MAG TPA: DUF177 domain-containing protein [Stellaceae bacterium]|nr:DUF177 domain-containing protein [Stellaceae bacterium]
MTRTAAPEFSRLVPLGRLRMEPFRQKITATAAERADLTRRFGLLALDRLSATVELARRGEDMFLLRAAFSAEFVQSCVVTLDPVGGAVSEEFTLLYGPPEMETQAGQTVEDEIAFEPLVGTAIDIGEAVAQQFSLVLPPFPRSPGATIDAEAPPADDSGPLAAALSRLADRRGEPPR